MSRTLLALALGLLIQLGAQAQKKNDEDVKWQHSAFWELTGRTGSVEKKRHSGGATSIRQSTNNRLKLFARYTWAEDSGVKSEEEYVAGIDDEFNLSKRTAWYLRGEYESDDIENLNSRITVASGIGYYFLKEKDHLLRGRIGLFHRGEDYKRGPDSKAFGVELGVLHQLEIEDVGRWTTELVYAPSLEEQRDYNISYDSKLELPFKKIEGFSTELGVYGLYKNYTPGPVEHFDTYFYIRLKYTW